MSEQARDRDRLRERERLTERRREEEGRRRKREEGRGRREKGKDEKRGKDEGANDIKEGTGPCLCWYYSKTFESRVQKIMYSDDELNLRIFYPIF